MQDDVVLTGPRVSVEATATPDEALERVRWELATMAGRLRAAEAERDVWQRRYDGMQRERDLERKAVRKLQSSESYRLGRAVVSFVKNPVKASPWLVRGAVRRLRPAGPRRGIEGTAAATAARRPAAPPAPVHLYVAIGLEPEALRALVRTVRQHALVNAHPRPVVVTDSPTFSLLRNLGVILEYIPDRVTWERHRDDVRWDDLLSGRLARLFRDHSSVRTVVVDRRDPPGLAQLIALDA